MGVLPPHIFAVANAAYSALVADKRNQSVIISGESGAGKTEATKLIMQFLAQRTNKQSSVESKILEANPVLEAFGNAATVRNNNSSRFGRYVEIQFDEHCSGIRGARITNYLLEKSRIVKQAQGERNYHIFYMFSEGCTPDMKNLYGLKDMSDFHYLNQSGVYYIPNVNDKQDWQRMLTAMALLGITEEEQSDIFAVLAAILHLGNVTFGTNDKNTAVVHDEESLRLASNLLRVGHDDLKAALTSRLIDVGKERMFKPLLREEATDARDTLAKSLYDRLFNWLVGKINASIAAEPEELPEGKKPAEPRFIGVLDIFGFENFAWNSLEQLCINYTNEALQQHFTQHIFKLEQKEYESQGVKWESIPFTDNQSCLDLIEGLRPPGVLALLDEESRFPKGTDESFLKKINEAHNKHKNYEMPRRRGNNFILKHYAGDVSYEVSEFLEKNRDSLSLNMAAAMNTSNLRLLNALFSEEENAATAAPPSTRSTGVLAQSLGSNSNSTMRGKSASSIISSFRVQLRTLMDTLTATAPHYVRCLKPNVLKLPAVFDSDLVLNQLRYAGMMETIKIRKAGFPVRLTLDVFWRNYKCLAPQTRDLVLERENLEMVKSGLKILLDALKGQGLTNPDDFQVGKTKLFMRDKQSAKLEERRLIMLKDHVITLQKHWRGYRERKKYRKARKAAILIQSTVRMAAARRRLKRSLCLVRFMQNRMRCCIVRKRYLKQRRAAISIQCAWRRLQAKRRQAAARERKTRDRADTAAAERERQKNEEKKEQHQKNKKKKDDAAEDLKQEVNMKIQNQQLEELGVRTELIALQAEFEQNGASSPGKSGSFAASFSSAQHTKGEEVAEVKEREVGKPQVDPFSHEDDLLIGEESAKLFNFHSYAIRNFSQHTSGVFRRKTVTAGQLLCFSMQPLAGALTRAVGEDENKNKIAIEISRKILLWMEKEDHAAARYVLLKGLVTREMREEIFCQLLRMLYRNGGTHFALNIWRLILFCCSTFRPPTSFTKYLLSFLYMHCSAEVREEENKQIASANKSRKKEKERRLDLANEPRKFDDRTIMFPLYGNRDVSTLADFTLKALRRTFQKGDRRMVPSVTELEALVQMEKIVCRFCMMDGRTSAFYVDAATTVSDVLASMCERIRITNSHGWSLLVTYNDHTYKLLRPNDRLVDILATYEELKKSMKLSKNIHIIDVDVQFVLKKLFFFEGPPERRDDIEINLLCWQAQNDLRCGRLWCSLAQTAKFAAIQLQYQVGDHDPKLNITEMLPQLLSKEMLNARDASYWERAIAAEHQKLVAIDPASAKKAYLQMASELPFYGHLPFIISTPPPREGEAPRVQPLGLPDKFALLIGATAIVFYNLETKEQIFKFDYSKVYEWSYTSTELYMTVFHSNNTAMDLVFPTTLGDDVSYMLTSYVDKLKEKAKYARALLDYKVDDESLLSFEKGAIINIIERSIDGWCLGEVQGKQGMFPVAMTEFILTDSADLSLIPMQPHSERRKKASGSTMRAGPIPVPEETKTSSKKKKETSSRKRTPTLRALGTLLLGDTKASTKSSSSNSKEEPLPSGSFYSPARGKRVEVVVGKAGGAHTMVAWAEYNFNKASTSKSGTLMKWKASNSASPNEMLSFSMSPIKLPLLVFNEVSSKEKKEKLVKQAVKIFTSIMKFMGDFPLGKSDRTKLAQEIVQEGLDEVLLRDEIYCQLIKQTNNNPKSDSMLKGFELMGLCVACFTGSPSFSPYLTQFLAEASDLSSDRDAVSADHARRVLRRLLKTMQVAHEREQAPSIFEIKALADSTPIMCMVELPDGDVKVFAVESHTTLHEASKDFVTKLGLPAKFTEGWGLWQSGLDGCYPLKQTLLVCDALALWEKGISASTAASSDATTRPSHSSAELVSSSAQTRQDRRRSTHYDTKRRVRPLSGRLTLASDMLAASDDSGAAAGSKRFRRSVTAALLPEVDRMFGFIFKKLAWMHNEFTADELIADSEALNYLCEQVVEDILGVLPLGEADAVEYASLLATARKPGAWRSLTAEQIMDFIPASVMNKRTGEQWLALMNSSLYAHQEKSTLQALGAVMERYFKSEFYGATVFPIVTKDSKLPEKALLAINVDRVAIYHPQTLELCQAWNYADISQWTMSSKDTWAIFVGDLFKPQCFTCHSPWANEIKMLYRTYAELVAASGAGSPDS